MSEELFRNSSMLRTHLSFVDFKGVHLLQICFVEPNLLHSEHPARLLDESGIHAA